MNFLNGVLLGGAVAGTVPLAIHLLNRNRTRVVRWGAMQLLQSNPKRRRRDIEFERILLLLLRISIPILLALCMARPIASTWKTNVHSATASIVIVLDDSASMAASTGDTSSFEKAKSQIAQFIESLGRGSEVAIISTTDSRHALIQTTVDTAGAAQKVRALLPSYQAADIPSAIEMAARHLSVMHNAMQRVIVFTDFQSANWGEQSVEQLRGAVQRLSSLKRKPSITLFDTGPYEPENAALESIDFTKLPVATKQAVRFDATIRNLGGQTKTNLPVVWKIDGKPIANTPVTVAPHQSTQVHIERSFDTPGTHALQATIEGDAFLPDNAFYATLNVQRSVRVLIVSGNITAEPFQGEADFLELALQPKTRANAEGGIFSLKTITPEDLTAIQLKETRVVILANTPRLKDSQVKLLEHFVEAGGGLAFFPGTRTDLAWSNQTLHADANGLLPTKIDEATSSRKPGNAGTGIASGPYTHSALDVFNSEKTNLTGVEVKTWYKLIPQQSPITTGSSNSSKTHASDPAFIFLSLENGDPLLVERRYGSGCVIQSAIPCNGEWSNFPTRPAFVPAMQRLIGHLCAESSGLTNIKAGEPIVTRVPIDAPALTIHSPDGSTHAAAVEKITDHAIVRFDKTREPGFYRLSGTSFENRCFAVNADRLESNPTRLGAAEIGSISKAIDAHLVVNSSELSDAVASTELGRELWRPLLWIILIFLFVEISLQQRFNPRAAATK